MLLDCPGFVTGYLLALLLAVPYKSLEEKCPPPPPPGADVTDVVDFYRVNWPPDGCWL